MIEPTMGMVDIETLSAEPAGAAIATVGLVAFRPDKVVDEGYWKLDLRWSPGRRSKDTYDWWMKQDARALEEAVRQQDHYDVTRLLPWDFCTSFSEFAGVNNMQLIWSYPARFDLGHLRELYHVVGHTFPLEFWRERDMTTLMQTAYGIRPDLESAVKAIRAKNAAAHNALADARNQVEVVQFLLSALNCDMRPPEPRVAPR